ncbi:MAG: tyrosine-type recombinase/integrase [archaeon]
MKKSYPSYKDRVTVALVERGLPDDQKRIVDDYCAFLSTTAGAGKVADYRRYMIQFYDIMEKPLNKLTPQEVIKFASLVNLDETRETNTKNAIKVTVKRFIKWFYDSDFEMLKTLDKLNQKFVLVNEKRINKGVLLTEKEIEKLLRTADSLKLKAQIITLYESACRPQELRTARWGALDWDRKTISFYANKTKKARTIPLDESIIHLKRWRQEFMFSDVTDNDYIFPSPRDRSKPIGRFEFTYWIRSLGKKAKINRPVYPYLLRHTRLTELHNKYKLQDQVHKKFAGHSPKSDMTGVYVAMDNEDMVQSVISQVYHVEELTPERKHELEEEIEKLRGEMAEMSKKIGRVGELTPLIDLMEKLVGSKEYEEMIAIKNR